MVHTGVAWPYSACRSGSGLNEGLGRTRSRARGQGVQLTKPAQRAFPGGTGAANRATTEPTLTT